MSNSVRPSRFNRPAQSPYAQGYIKAIEQGGAGFSQAAQDFAKQFSAIKGAEAKAMAMIPDADFTGDSGPNSAFASDANKLMQKIQGGVEGSYNFANPAEVERFNMDVAALKKEMNEFEPIYNQAVTNLQELSLEHDLFVKVGEDPRQAASKEVNGRAFYNNKASTKVFDEVMRMADALRYGEVITDDSGKVTVTDQNGQAIADYPSRQDYLKAIVELGKPDFQPIPATDGGELVEEKNWATEFKTPTKAEGGFLNFVLNNPALAERRRREKLGLTESEPEGLEMSDEVRELFERHPITTKNFDGMSQAQYDYVQEMMEGWRARQDIEKPKTGSTAKNASAKKRDQLMGQVSVGQQTYTLNGDSPEGFSKGAAASLPLKGQVLNIGGERKRAEKLIYDLEGNFSVVVADDTDGQEEIVFDPFSGDPITDALVASLGLSQQHMKDIFTDIANRAE